MGWFLHSAQKVLGSVFNYRVDKWIDLDNLKGNFLFTVQQTKNLFFKKNTPIMEEEFDEARERLDLSDEDLLQQLKQYKNLSLFFILLSFLIFLYFIYLLHTENYMGAMMSFSLTIFGLSQAFRYHFWMVQIKRKKLGCTLKEWWATLCNKENIE